MGTGSSKTILIIGGSGFIGTHIALRLRDEYKVFATYYRHPINIPGISNIPMNLMDPDWVKRAIYTSSPDVVIYAVGGNNVHAAEDKSREAENLHVGALAPVLKASTIFQPRFIYVSTCYTFDGAKGNYHEVDTILAATTLGKLKISGENFVRGRALNYSIVRLSPVYGRGNGCSVTFVDRIRARLAKKQKVEVDQSELHSFVSAPSVAEFIHRIIESGPRNKVHHLGGITKCTYYEFTKMFARRFKFDESLIAPQNLRLIQPSNINAPPQIADFSLNSTESISFSKLQPLLLEQGFDELEKAIRSGGG